MNYCPQKKASRPSPALEPALRLMSAVIHTARHDYAIAYRRKLNTADVRKSSYAVLQNEAELRELRSFFVMLLGKYRAGRVLRDMERTVENGGRIESEHMRRDARAEGGSSLWL